MVLLWIDWNPSQQAHWHLPNPTRGAGHSGRDQGSQALVGRRSARKERFWALGAFGPLGGLGHGAGPAEL